MKSPLLDLASYNALIAESQAAAIDPRVALAWMLWEDHFGTDPAGGIALAAVFNFGGIKWAGQANAFDSGIEYPHSEGPNPMGTYTYAGFHDAGAWFHELYRTLNNQYIGPYFKVGDLANAASVYITGQPNSGKGQSRVDTYNEYVVAYPADGTPPPVPPPVPPPPLSGVTGDDVIDLVRRYIGQGASDNTLDPWNKPHVWGGWCEALFDGICYTLNIDEVHRGTALQKGDAVEAEGLAQTSWPPEHGAGVCYGANFDVQGHITFWDADMGQFLGTLENPSNIGYHATTGAWRNEIRCWFRLPGVVAARRSTPPPPVIENLVIPGNPYNVGRAEADRFGVGGAIRTFWESLGEKQFQVLGFPMANEVTAIVTNADKTTAARTVQKFERSWVVFAPEAPDGWKVTLALLNQKIQMVTMSK